MAYTQGETINLTANSGGLLLFSSGTGSYAENPDARIANITKKVTVTVVDNGDGTLTATADSTTDAPVKFTNNYKAGTTTASFPVTKEMVVPAMKAVKLKPGKSLKEAANG